MSIKHRNLKVNELNNIIDQHVLEAGNDELLANNELENNDSQDDTDQSKTVCGVTEEISESQFVQIIALFLLKLQCKFHIPVSKVQEISCELYNLHSLSCDSILCNLQQKLTTLVDAETKSVILNEVKLNDPFLAALGIGGMLKTIHNKKSFYKNCFKYIEPFQIELSLNDKDQICKYHNVPIKETISALCDEQAAYNCLFKDEVEI